jgi:hypothetical protein
MDMDYTRSLAEAHGVAAQGEKEGDRDFRIRVAGVLRERGLLVESQEAYNGARFDSEEGGEAVRTGLMGALSQALHGIQYSPGNPERQVEDDAVLGTVIRRSKPEPSTDMLLLGLELFGDKGRDK